MIAAAFDHRERTGVAHGEAFACDALEIGLAGNRAVQHGVADDDVLGRLALCFRRLSHDNAAAGQTLADIIVGVAGQFQREPRARNAPKLPPALPRRLIWIVSSGRPAWP